MAAESVSERAAVFDKKMNRVIELKRRNWENHGTDVRIDPSGKYVVMAVFLGKTKKVRQGILTPIQMENLGKSVKEANFFALQDEYKTPFKTARSWWGYQLKVEKNHDSKSLRFHSEDDQVPAPLKRFVEKKMEFTK